MKLIGIIFALTLVSAAYSVGQNPFWVQIDKKIIEQLNAIDRANPREVESYFFKHVKTLPERQDLGFGWSKQDVGIGGGYVSFNSTILYRNDTIISFSVYADLPIEKTVIERYREWFGEAFVIDSNKRYTFNFQEDRLSRPLTEYDGALKPELLPLDILNYASPHSGTMYGYSGGINNTLLANRRTFKSIETNLSGDEIYFLMFSTNPASRLTAIEYYKRNPDKFENRDKIDSWIEIVYRELPKVNTLIGCIGMTMDSKVLVELCTSIEDP